MIFLSLMSMVTYPLRFFLITVLFLLFDIEMVLFLPLPLSLGMVNIYYLFVLVGLFVMLLMFGLYFEWQQGSLEWN